MIGRLLIVCAVLSSCCPAPQPTAEPKAPTIAANYVYLYARLHETQEKATAEDQYLPNIREAFANFDADFEIEEIRGAEKTVEFIGIDAKIAAQESETDFLETLFLDTLRLSGAPYATQIFIVVP
ncbi:MAG: hypothetical protein ACI8XO_003790 [Verrucomicrobiales bacterium]|jgi:hypothetical protein